MKKSRKCPDREVSKDLGDKYISGNGSQVAAADAISPMEQLRVAAHDGLMQAAQKTLDEHERDYRITQRDIQRRNNFR